MKLLFFIMLIIVSLLSDSSFVTEATAVTTPAPAPSGVPCDALCGKRCAKAGIQKRCLKYCNICCRKCKCVPSGTYGHKSECPCYRDMLNSKGKPKCP